MFTGKQILFNILIVALFMAMLTILISSTASGDRIKADIVVGMEEGGRTAAIQGSCEKNYIYAATGESDNIIVIDPCTISMMAPIPIDRALNVQRMGDRRHDPLRAPEPLALNKNGTRLYTANEGDKTVSIVDTTARRVLATMPVDGAPESILFNDDRGHLYVGIEDKNKVQVIDPVTLSTITAIPVGKGPDGLALSGDRSKLFVSNEGDDTVSVIDAGSLRVIDTIKVGIKPAFIVSNPALGHLYVVNDKSADVHVIDMATHKTLGTIKVGTEPESAAVNKAGTRLYVCNEADKTISVIDTATLKVIGLITIEGEPESIAVDPICNHLYIYDESHNLMRVIDGSTHLQIATLTLAPFSKTERPDLDVGIIAPGSVRSGDKVTVIIEVENEIPATSYVDNVRLYDGNTLLKEWTYAPSNRQTEKWKWHLTYEGSFAKTAMLRAEVHSSDGRFAHGVETINVTE